MSPEQIIATSNGMRYPRQLGMDLTKITPDSDGKKYLLPDEFFARIPGSHLGRILPRTLVDTAIASGATSLIVTRAKNFVAGDVLSVLAPLAKLNILSASGGWVAGDTITLTIANYVLVYTVVSGDVGGSLTETNANIAAKIVAAIAADPYLSKIVGAKAGAGATVSSDVFIWALDFITPYTIGVADTGTNGTAAIGGSLTALRAGQAIGTIAASGVDTTTNTLTISASSTNLPEGMPIGVAGVEPLGLAGHIFDLDLEDNVSGYVAATIYKPRIEYWDGEIARLFPGLQPFSTPA